MDLQANLAKVGDRVLDSFRARGGKRDFPKPDGRPGRRWDGYEARLKRWGHG